MCIRTQGSGLIPCPSNVLADIERLEILTGGKRAGKYYPEMIRTTTRAADRKTVLEIMQQFFKDEKSKINPEGLALLKEVLRIFVSEAANRAAVQADKDGSDEVTVEQVEKILPELLLDL